MPALGGRPAGFWIRLLAFVIDSILVSVIGYMILPDGPSVQVDTFADWQRYVLNQSGWSWFLNIAYYTLTTSIWGTTLGKRVLRMWVVDRRGRKITFLRALARYLSTFISGIILCIGYLMIASRHKRALHDLIADTWVVIR